MFGPISNGIQVAFPQFWRKILIFKNNFFEYWDFHSVNTHTSFMVMFSFNLMAKVYVIANLFFLLTQNDIIVYFYKFPNFGVYHTYFANLKGPRAPPPSQNWKKKPDG